ncbi:MULTISPECIES: dermonecrotic toxin domain-containing protein [Pseudomonas]|uniref:dermonecrotic toxin domain-containing protein n=1 Tax=Pseudomonas TaxID=286 RepID=UPI000CFFD211|nr:MULTISPECIES: DUF6543 domain-containing protein [Pseudomonas]PRA59306.1 hypothetical protein CQZ98_05610 [Pseudomonas sp. MYb115]QXN49196.1 hypothetical protein KW062_23420 [Pseudomonas fluorescens]WSO23507.1 DUF6543 domain-containing protein [Pseudomonas fluorescens]
MFTEFLPPSHLREQIDKRDNPAQAALRKTLSALDTEVTEQLALQPTFHAFVQQRCDEAFADLAPGLQLLHCFVQSGEQPQAISVSSLLPSLMDAAVRRIVSSEPANYAERVTVFYRVPAGGSALERYTDLDAAQFDAFLDRLAHDFSLHYGLYLQRYWSNPLSSSDTRPRQQWLEELRREQMKTECALLKLDGLLDSDAQTLLETVLQYPDAVARQRLRRLRPCVYGLGLGADDASVIPLQGAVVLTARDPQDAQEGWETGPVAPVVRPIEPNANAGRVLLFIPDRGLEAFDSLASLDRELHRRLGDPLECLGLLQWVADKDQNAVSTLARSASSSGKVRYLERLDSPFSFTIESQCLLIRDNAASAIARYQARGVHADMTDLPRALDRVSDLQRVFNVGSVLQARQQKRTLAALQTFLGSASDGDKTAWVSAFTDYAEALAHLPDPEGLPSLSQFSDRRSLLIYSNRQLRAVLESEYGVTVDPDNILVTTSEPDIAAVTYAPGAHGSTITEPRGAPRKYRSRTLTELALENVAGLDFNFSNFSTLTLKAESRSRPAGIPLSPNLNPVAGRPVYQDLSVEQVKDLVRRVNVGQTYRDFLSEHLTTSEAATLRKHTFARLMALQLRLDLIEAKIAGDFAPDRLARGYHWVKAVLDHPVDNHQRVAVEGHRIIVQCLHIRGQRVRGVLLFSTATQGGGSVVVYTPQAPDGRVFHEYAREDLMQALVHNSLWRYYLVARVALAFQPQVRASMQGRGDVSVVNLVRIGQNLFEEGYETEANFAINDAAAQTTTTGQTDVETGLTIGDIVLDVVTLVLPIRVTLPIGLARSLFAVFNAIEAGKVGDRSATAHYVVRALGEFTGALVDGAVGKGIVGAKPLAAVKVASAARRLNPEMALGKRPQGVTPLPGWEDKGIHYRTAKVEGTRQYFLKDADHWYSILDEGFEEAWRVRDARKPVQYHYSPIRRNAAGRWEIGTHPDAPARGGLSPERALRDLYPSLDEFQARRVFESFMFPRGREMEFGLSLVHYLRARRTLEMFDSYLMVSPERLQLRLRGLDLAPDFSGGGVVRENLPATPLEPVPGPSRPAPVPTRPARPANEQFVDWGQAMDPAQLRLLNPEQGIYRRIVGDQQLIGREYVKIDQRYFPILPAGADINSGVILMHEPGMPLDSFVAFEQMLGADLFRQPRLATFDTPLSRWVHALELSFEKTLASYVADAFPTFSHSTQVQIANVLFNLGNPSGLTVWGIAAIQRTLQSWRSLSVPTIPVLGDPLSLLPLTRTNAAGIWQLESVPSLYHCLSFRTDGVQALLHGVMASPIDNGLKALMVERLVVNHYQMVAGFSQPGELLFRRPGSDKLFWLSLRKAYNGWVEGPYQVAPRLELMDAWTQTLITRAQASDNFVQLVGGAHLPAPDARASIFMFRI